MPFLPLQAKPYVNLDRDSRQGIAAFYDAGKDDVMGNTRRPGLGGDNDYFVDLGTGKPVDSIIEWVYQDWAVAVSGGKLFKIESDGTTTEITGFTFQEGNPATAADFGNTLYLANGGSIAKWSYTATTAAALTDVDAPTSVTHVVFLNQYLLALDTSALNIKWARVDSPDTWEGEFATPELKPDKPVALHSGWEELFIPGEETLEHWFNSGGAATFSRLQGSSTERGIIAPYSIDKIDNTYFFLDHERKVIRLVGRQPQVLSTPWDREIQKMDTVSDARGMHVFPNGETFYVLTFPTEGRTFAYDYKRDVWGEWSYWNNTEGDRDNWLGNCSCYMRSWNKHLVGSRLDGKIYLASTSTYQDGGNPNVWEVWTGWNNYGTDNWKTCSELRLQLRRGEVGNYDGKTFEVYYRDNGNSKWVGPRHIDLGFLGDTEHTVTLRRLGRYRSRQWRFRCSENVPVNLLFAEEIVR